MTSNEKIKRIIDIINNYADLRYDLADENNCCSGVNEKENTELISFLNKFKK